MSIFGIADHQRRRINIFFQWSYSFFFFLCISEVVGRVFLCRCVHSCWPLLHSVLWERVTNFPVMPSFSFLFCVFFSFVDLFVDLFTFYYPLRTCMSCLHCLCCSRFSLVIAVFFVIPFFFLSTPLVYHSGPCFLHSLLSAPWIVPCVGSKNLFLNPSLPAHWLISLLPPVPFYAFAVVIHNFARTCIHQCRRQKGFVVMLVFLLPGGWRYYCGHKSQAFCILIAASFL